MMQLKCIKTGETFPFQLNFFNNSKATDSKYSSLVLEGGFEVEGYKSLVPFKKLYLSYGGKDTPLVENKKVSRLLGLNNLKIKDESYNPYGTHKDRRSEYIINVAIENNVDKIVCLTAGNAGYSLSRYCARAKIDYTSLLFQWVSNNRKKDLQQWGEAITIDGSRYNGILRPRDFQQIVAEHDKYERQKERENIWAVTNSFEPISINAYKELFYEIKDEKPDYIVVPCGSGDIIIGIWLAIKELGLKTKIIGVGPKGEHPIKNAMKYGTDEYQIENYYENSIAEKLTTPFTAVLPMLYKIFSEKGNIYVEVTNEEIEKTKDLIDPMGIKAENSAAVAFAVFLGEERPEIDIDANIIIVSTGKGIES